MAFEVEEVAGGIVVEFCAVFESRWNIAEDFVEIFFLIIIVVNLLSYLQFLCQTYHIFKLFHQIRYAFAY